MAQMKTIAKLMKLYLLVNYCLVIVFVHDFIRLFVAPSLQLRLLRVFKLAQTWSTMRVLLAIVIKTLGAMGNLTFILVIVMYIFAVIGMQLFSTTYTEDKFAPDEKPR